MSKKFTSDELAWNLRTPCGDCPFKKDSPFHEGIALHAKEKVDAIMAGGFAHTCHKTDNRESCDGPRNWKKEKMEHCAGALMALLKSGNKFTIQFPILNALERGDISGEAIREMKRAAHKDKNIFTVNGFLKAQTLGICKHFGLKFPKGMKGSFVHISYSKEGEE